MNRNATIAVVVVVALAPVYVGLSWLTGQAAHARISSWEEQLVGQPGQLFTIAGRKKTQGVFNSVEEVTLEFNRAIFDELKRQQDAQADAEVSYDEETGEPVGAEESAMDDESTGGSEESSEESVAANAPETAPGEPWRVTIRNDIQHGPLPGFRSAGIARIESRLVLDQEIREQLEKELGIRDPFVAVTRLGFLGGGVTSIESPEFQVKTDEGLMLWKGIEAEVAYGRNLNSFKCDAKAPGMEMRKDDAVVISMAELSFDCDLDRVFDELYTGTMALTIKHIRGTPDAAAPAEKFSVEGVRYAVEMDADGDYLDVALEVGVQAMEIKTVSLQDVDYNFSLTHLHGPTLADMSRKLKETSQPAAMGSVPAALVMVGAFAEYVPILLEHSPVLVVDRIGFRMPEGELGVKGTVKVNDFKREEFVAMQSPMMLLAKVDAAFDVWLSEGLLNKDWGGEMSLEGADPSGPTGAQRAAMVQQQVSAMEQAGYVMRKNGRLESRIEFKNGALTANGKPLGPPMQ